MAAKAFIEGFPFDRFTLTGLKAAEFGVAGDRQCSLGPSPEALTAVKVPAAEKSSAGEMVVEPEKETNQAGSYSDQPRHTCFLH